MNNASTLKCLDGLIPAMALKDRIAELLRAGFTKSQLARAAGVSAGAVTQWCTGDTKELKGGSVAGLADLTGFSPTWISDGRGPKRQSFHQQAPGNNIASEPPPPTYIRPPTGFGAAADYWPFSVPADVFRQHMTADDIETIDRVISGLVRSKPAPGAAATKVG